MADWLSSGCLQDATSSAHSDFRTRDSIRFANLYRGDLAGADAAKCRVALIRDLVHCTLDNWTSLP